MLETPHAVLGIAIATAIPNPMISIPLSFASHFLLDMVPHWNPHLNTETKKYGRLTNQTLFVIAIDIITMILATIFLAKGNMNIYLSAFAAIAPDAIEGPYFLWGWKNKYVDIWMKFQKSIQADANIFWGLLTQALVLLTCFMWLY